MALVTLSPADLALALQMAHERNDEKVLRAVRNDRIYSRRSDFETHYMGIKAELAVARKFRAEIDRSVSLHGDDHRGDLILPSGRTISVKCRRKIGWDFALTGIDPGEFKADLGVLCYACSDPADVIVVGWVTRGEFLSECERADYGYGPRLVLPAVKFHSV